MQTEVLLITKQRNVSDRVDKALDHNKKLRLQMQSEVDLGYIRRHSPNSVMILDLPTLKNAKDMTGSVIIEESQCPIIGIVSPHVGKIMEQVKGKINVLVGDKGIEDEINMAIEVSLQGGIYISPYLVDHFKHSNDISETDVKILTKTEIKVLKAARRGLTNKQLASQLYVSPNTIHSHCRNIYRKLGVRGRVEAINVVFGGVG